MMSREYRTNRIIVVVVVCVIAYMFFSSNFQGGGKDPREARNLAEFPNVCTDTGINLNWMQEFEDWIKDNIGLREEFIHANYVCRWKLFDMVESKKYLVENNGWGYYIDKEDGDCISDYMGNNKYSVQELESIGNNARRFVEAYKKIGYQDVYFIVTPSRMQVESQYVPDKYYRMSEEGRCEQVCNYLSKDVSLHVVYPKDALINFQEMQGHRTYYRYDIHWNRFGAFVAANELLKNMGQEEVSMQECNIYQMQEREPGGLAGGLRVENCVDEIPIDTFVGFQNGVMENSESIKIEEITGLITNIRFTCTEPLMNRSALVVGDSNRTALTAFLPHIFSETQIMLMGDKARETLVNAKKKDILIFVCDERYFPHSLNTYMFQGIEDYGVELFQR